MLKAGPNKNSNNEYSILFPFGLLLKNLIYPNTPKIIPKIKPIKDISHLLSKLLLYVESGEEKFAALFDVLDMQY